MKMTTNKVWVHILCALTSNNAEIEDLENMKIKYCESSGNDEEVKKTEFYECEICEQEYPIHSLKCQNKNCDGFIHFLCWYQSEKRDKEDWEFLIEMICQQNNIINPFTDENLKTSIKNKVILKMNTDMEIEMDKSKLYKQPNNSHFDEDCNIILPKIFSKLSLKEKHQIDQKNKNKYGGNIKIFCREHQSDPIFCKCRSEEEGKEMVYCDNCGQWWHNECTKFSGEDIFYCSRCQEFDNLKIKSLSHLKTVNQSNRRIH